MNRHFNIVRNRLSLRPPQADSLQLLAELCELLPPTGKKIPVVEALARVRERYPQVKDFERDFVSLCFALATGVGKTRLMGAFIAYLHQAYGLKHFFVLAPNLTIYNKLIQDFTPNTPKYVFKGIGEFETQRPEIITGETYDMKGSLLDRPDVVQINIFNISKINSELRGGKSPRIRKLSEYLGQSYFDYLAKLPDLVLLMDESHRYRASAGIRALNELQPVLGLELTATPYIETSKGPVRFQNIIYDYSLAQAMTDGFVKEPVVVTRKDFQVGQLKAEEVEWIKLEDGIRLHEKIKAELLTYARQNGVAAVKPFVLVIARDTTHAAELLRRIQEKAFFEGAYADKVIQVDSSRTGLEEEEMVSRLLKVEQADEPTEIVIHVNMLKEGWDVTNLYTIIPLRAANARVLIEQSIGRGLRLPYGKRTGVAVVDQLNIVAHDRFQEIIDEANRAGSMFKIQIKVLDEAELKEKSIAVPVTPMIDRNFQAPAPGEAAQPDPLLPASTATPDTREAAIVTQQVIQELARRTDLVPTTQSLTHPEVQAEILRKVEARVVPVQLALEGMVQKPDLGAIVAEVALLVQRQTIDIPRIVVLPKGAARFVFSPFELDLTPFTFVPVGKDLYAQRLRTGDGETIGVGTGAYKERSPEDHIVRQLLNFPEIDYESTSDMLYALSGEVYKHFEVEHGAEAAAMIIRYHERMIAQNIYVQMKAHFHIEAEGGYEWRVSQGYEALRSGGYTGHHRVRKLRDTVENKSKIGTYLFNGFTRCLYDYQKFDSNSERVMALILEREAEKWFRPLKGQFQIHHAGDQLYVPDFVAETTDAILMIEVKQSNMLDDKVVLGKRLAAEAYCARATEYNQAHGAKPWIYLLLPSDQMTENMSLEGLILLGRAKAG